MAELHSPLPVPELTAEEQELLSDLRRRKRQLLTEIQDLKDEISDVSLELENLEGQGDAKTNSKSRVFVIARKKFNMNAKKGIEYLLEHNLIENDPKKIAKYLFETDGLSKTMMGEYMGLRDSNPILIEFTKLHNFTGMEILSALRKYLWSFRLPGESQKIDRVIESFARRYDLLNRNVFPNEDACYLLAFSIIMLNTGVHNPSIKSSDRITLERFMNMHREERKPDSGPEIKFGHPVEMLTGIYKRIKDEPLKIPESDVNDLAHTFFNPDREGWLWKQGGRYKSWRRRWFILTDNCLYYFEYTIENEPKGIIPLENVGVKEVDDSKKPHCFEIYQVGGKDDFIKACKSGSDGKMVEGKHQSYRMSAPSYDEKMEWIKSIQASITKDPFYEMLAARKKRAVQNRD